MKKARAIELLRELSNFVATPPETDEALNMAIEALEQQNCNNCKYSEETNGMNCYECVKGISDNFEALQQDEIIRCKDCKYWHEWENGTGSCHRSDIMWVGSDYDDYCSFAERK